MARKITLAELKKMAAKLNALKLGKENLLEAIGAEKCKTSGKFDALADSFMDAMEACADDDKASKKVPKVIEVFHNRLFDQVNPEEEDPETEPDEGEEEPEEGEEEPEEGEEPDEGEEGEEGKR
ncbi:MAG: hypothetical protein KAQ85_07945, partial [Thermodesulfovibrionia bacterium]|nr:hypothetical protein [Thermodesulfovibrionia bacterium]